jgi:hypothetical protein
MEAVGFMLPMLIGGLSGRRCEEDFWGRERTGSFVWILNVYRGIMKGWRDYEVWIGDGWGFDMGLGWRDE